MKLSIFSRFFHVHNEKEVDHQHKEGKYDCLGVALGSFVDKDFIENLVMDDDCSIDSVTV